MSSSPSPLVEETVRLKLLPAAGVSASAVLLFGLHLRPLGYVVLVLSLVGAFLVERGLVADARAS